MENTKKILFFDIDGTLYNTEKKIPKATKEAIEKAKQNGHEVVIATGRAPFFLQDVMKELNIDSYVSFNGQFVVYKGVIISRRPIPLEVLNKLTQEASKDDRPIVFLDAFKMTSTIDAHDEVKISMDSLFYPMPEYAPEHYQQSDIFQVLLYVDETEEQVYMQKFPQLKFIRWHEFSSDVINHDVSKAYGIEQFLKHTSFEMKDAIAFGDGLNDVEMLALLAQKGTSVAMGNGHTKAKEVATFVTDHVDEDGIAKAMAKLNLI